MATVESTPRRPDRRRARRAGALIAALVAATVAAAWAGLGRRGESPHAPAARAALARLDLDAADAEVARWLAGEPRSPAAHRLKARAALARDRPNEALEELALARSLGDEPDALGRLHAAMLAQSGRFAEAEPALRRGLDATAAADFEPEVAEGLAKVYLATYRLGAAREVLERWKALAAADPKPCLWLADVDARSMVEPSAIVEHFREALRRAPSHPEARLRLAEGLLGLHRNDEAKAEFVAYLAARPDDPAARLGAARNAAELGDDASAIAHLDRALALAPDDPAILMERASADLRANRPVPAVEHLRHAAEVEPYHLEVRQRLAQALAGLGRREEAEAARAAVKRLRADHERLAEVQAALARTPDDLALRDEATAWLFDHGRAKEGLLWARQTLQIRPRHAPALRLLADHHRKAGDPGLANSYRLQIPE